jgi:hypothetical protein
MNQHTRIKLMQMMLPQIMYVFPSSKCTLYQICNIIFAKETRGDPRVHQWFGGQLQQRSGCNSTRSDSTGSQTYKKTGCVKHGRARTPCDQRNKTAEDAHLEEAADEHREPTCFHPTGAQRRTSSTETRSAGFKRKKKEP